MTGSADILDAPLAASALRWWDDAGVDVLIDETPVPWLERIRKPSPAVKTAAPAPELARPATLEAFIPWIKSMPDPAFGPAHLRIPASGNATASLMIVTDMPEAGDEGRGTLISGDAGILFERMLSAIGLERSGCYLAALAPARPATGMISDDALPPLADMMRHHIALARPKWLWLMGGATSRALLGMDVVEARGSLHKINHAGSNVEAMVSFAPPFLLKNPQRKAAAWAEMQALVKRMNA